MILHTFQRGIRLRTLSRISRRKIPFHCAFHIKASQEYSTATRLNVIMDSSTALSQSMRLITTTKLASLSKQRKDFETKKKQLRQKVANTTDPAAKVSLLLDECPLPDIEAVSAGFSKENIERFLAQCRYDPSISQSLIRGWQTKLEDALDVQSAKFEYATLFGQLVTEWIENPNDAAINPCGTPHQSADGEPQDSFEQIGRKEMYEQRQQWESIVFKESTSNPAAITRYLQGLFSPSSQVKKLTKSPLEILREKMDEFEIGQLDMGDLKNIITSLVKTDLLSEHKRTILGEFKRNDLVLTEIADVLNMQLHALHSWSWGREAIPLEMRRNLNGKYRVYMDEEILQAVLLHYVGLRWAVHLKETLQTFFHSGAWKEFSQNSPNKKAKQRREKFLGPESRPVTMRTIRRDTYVNDFFMSQLPSSIKDGARDYDDAEKSHDKSKAAPVDSRQSMLSLVTTESLMNRRLHGSFTILQTDFQWFGPSLPHSTISAVLEFLGVSPRWLKFFHTFLKTPVKFVHDGPGTEMHIRRCGVPISHVLSDALTEAVLFCLDFAVNQSTHSNLYRLHDDLWFWGQEDVCVKAWKAITDFVHVMGLSLNQEKTGAVRVSDGSADLAPFPQTLPQGGIKLGFLKLDQSGEWRVDDQKVDQHIEELARQLSACKSVFAWIQAWNRYVTRFFSANLGQPALCLGRRHVDMVMETFLRIQRVLFGDGKGHEDDVATYLKRKLAEKFQVTNVPDGFLNFPIELGGLDVQNPIIPLMLARESTDENPMEAIDLAIEGEEKKYEEAKKAYENGEERGSSQSRLTLFSPEDEPFMSLEEFKRYPEETSTLLAREYSRLQKLPEPKNVQFTPEVKAALGKAPMSLSDPAEDPAEDWEEMSPYLRWVLELYGTEIITRFGSLRMSDKKLLPIGLTSMLRSEKIRWQG
jgi:hypothetical protein